LLVPSYEHLDVFESETQEDKVLASQLALRGSVGGTTGLISLNQSVAEGFTNREAAVQILVNLYGVEQETANQMVTTLTNTQNNS
jgi:Holliday junction resolvasome RuvABC DNA-binding subunit